MTLRQQKFFEAVREHHAGNTERAQELASQVKAMREEQKGE